MTLSASPTQVMARMQRMQRMTARMTTQTRPTNKTTRTLITSRCKTHRRSSSAPPFANSRAA
eukprot:3924131-Rhodomonas_salina.1